MTPQEGYRLTSRMIVWGWILIAALVVGLAGNLYYAAYGEKTHAAIGGSVIVVAIVAAALAVAIVALRTNYQSRETFRRLGGGPK